MAETLGVEILERWEMAVSSKKGSNLKRRDLQEAMTMCKKHKDIKYILFDRVNRLGREARYLTLYRLELEIKHNVELIFCDPGQQRLNGTTAESFRRFVEKIVEAEQENEEKSQLNKARMLERFNQGYFPLPVKLGYKKSTTPGLHVPNEPYFTMIKESMMKIIGGTHDAKEALAWATHEGLLTKQGKPIDMYRWIRLLKQPYYAGIITASDWGARKGLHQAMISEDEFEELQYKIQAVKPRHRSTRHFNPKFPLQTLASCGVCGGVKRITGSTSTNGHGGTFDRYYCMECKTYQQKKNVHAGLSKLLEKTYLANEDKELLLEALKTVWKEKEGDQAHAIASLQRKKIELEEHKRKLVSTLVAVDSDIAEDIQTEIRNAKDAVREIDEQVKQLQETDEDMLEFTKFALDYADKLLDNFWSLQKEDLLWCQKIVFPGEIILYKNGIFGTNELSPIYRLARTKKDLLKGPLFAMVEMPGTAPGSEK
jgi:DNA invertase Pin-like site-specific DNA recombinase